MRKPFGVANVPHALYQSIRQIADGNIIAKIAWPPRKSDVLETRGVPSANFASFVRRGRNGNDLFGASQACLRMELI